MKYLFSLIFSILLLNVVSAQDYKKVLANVLLNKMEDAKRDIDKIEADPKGQNKPETWYWKSKIYASINKNEVARQNYPTILSDAEKAIRKYIELDPTFAIVKEKGPEGFFDLYTYSFNTGLKDFKDKNWAGAATDFEGATFYSDYIFKNKWSSSQAPFDTTSILYAAYSNQNAKQLDNASKYYLRLAEAKCTGEGYQDIYKFLVEHFMNQKDKNSFDKVLSIGRELYPSEKASWEYYETEYIDQNFTLAEKTDFYDKGDAAGTITENQYLQFGDVFVNVRHKETDSAKFDFYTKKGVEAFKKAYAKNNQNALAAYNVAVIYYNYFNESDDRYAANIKAMQQLNLNRPVEKDPKKKAATDANIKLKAEEIKKANVLVEKESLENVETSLDWLTKSFTLLKDKEKRTNTEKSVINKTVDFLANLYYYKMNKVRGKDAKAYDALELKYKEYDNLHGKY